ncbi:MAG: T6SS immunity protein Tli4 family protein [Telluria sp.]|nr:T6SS immunity protein Tli4 family protein [Telluria sp.]
MMRAAIRLAVIVVVSLSGAFEVNAVELKMSQETKTMCVGRFLIDVPADAIVSFRPHALADWHIATNVNETDGRFADRLMKLEIELAARKNGKNEKSLESVREIRHEGMSGKVFIHGREWLRSMPAVEGASLFSVAVAVTAYVRVNGVSYIFSAKIVDPDDAEQLTKLISHVKVLAADEIPIEPGFCIERGIIRDSPTPDPNERITMIVGLKEYPDIEITVATAAGLRPNESLLEREDRYKKNPETHTTVLRRGSRILAGLQGEELVERFSIPDCTSGQVARWEAVGTLDNVLAPTISLDLTIPCERVDKPVGSSPRDEAMLAFWDKMASSLRLRPTKILKPVVAVAPIPPTGSYSAVNDSAKPQQGPLDQIQDDGVRLAPRARKPTR